MMISKALRLLLCRTINITKIPLPSLGLWVPPFEKVEATTEVEVGAETCSVLFDDVDGNSGNAQMKPT
jgi:hypothetical protein